MKRNPTHDFEAKLEAITEEAALTSIADELVRISVLISVRRG